MSAASANAVSARENEKFAGEKIMAKYLIASFEIMFVLLFVFYAAIFHSTLSVSAFMFFECVYIVLLVANSILSKKKRYVVVLLVQFFLFAAGLFLMVSESSFDGSREGRALKTPCLSEAIFFCALFVMICTVSFLVYKNLKNINRNSQKS